ncbi:MAG: twin-arginine translocase TatA/TatE family subunit [Bacillota bacterium]|nr:twin-arginine translocase TatA/TatE family subunit [Bacillota bacterium]MDW7683082.1 twin-arginine translocase TatA/TatE family subunit [Bacillota bacterium]
MLGTRIGTSELLLIFALVLVVFGPQRLPEIGRALGRGMRDFKKALTEIQSDGNE